MTGDAVFDPASSTRILSPRIVKSIPEISGHEFYKTENGDLLFGYLIIRIT